MPKVTVAALAALLGLTVLPITGTQAADVDYEAMATKYACVSCHEIDFKKVGPSYEEVARKYRGADAKTVDTLVKHVKEGSTGIWGSMIMPAQAQIPEQDVRALVAWVLAMDSKK